MTHKVQVVRADGMMDGDGPVQIFDAQGRPKLNAHTVDSLHADATGAADAHVVATDASGHILYGGDLKPIRSATTYTGYAYVPLAASLLNADWDGDAKNVGTYTLTPANFGYPAAAKALAIQIHAQWAAASAANMYARNPTSGAAATVTAAVASSWNSNAGIVSCNASGEFVIIIAIANTTGTYIEVSGYFL